MCPSALLSLGLFLFSGEDVLSKRRKTFVVCRKREKRRVCSFVGNCFCVRVCV